MASVRNQPKKVQCFTDGSCETRTREGGWGYLLVFGERRKAESGYEADTTNNRMELTAAVRALQALTEPCQVEILTDSQYLKRAFTDRWLENWQGNGWRTAAKKPVKNKDLWLELLKQGERHELSWLWTKGHAGHPENEWVDTLALKARKTRRGQCIVQPDL